MTRLYCPKELISGKQIVINERKQIHYLCDVLRLKVGDDLFIFDGEAHEYYCQIRELSKKAVRLSINEEVKIKNHQKVNLIIACALPKQKSRFDDLVDKLSQLGVDKIIPMITQRVVVRWGVNQKQRYHQRWQKIAEGACTQSGRNILPVIEPIIEIEQVLTRAEFYELKLICTILEGERPPSRKSSFSSGLPSKDSIGLGKNKSQGHRQSLKDILSAAAPRPKNTLVLIGPEGDFTKKEASQAKEAGFIPVLLGDLVLRVDTAAIAVAAFFRLYES